MFSIYSNELQDWKAFLPIVVTLLGMWNELIDVQFENELSPIVTIPFARHILDIFSQFLKSSFPILVRLSFVTIHLSHLH